MPIDGAGQPPTDTQQDSLTSEIQRLLDLGYTELERTTEMSPADAIKRCNAALSMFKQALEQTNEMDEADSPSFKKLIQLAVSEAFSQRGHQHRYAQNHKEALPDLSQALRRNPDRSEDYYYRGLSRLADGDPTQARNDFTEYMKRGNNDYLREQARLRISALVPSKDDTKATLAHWRNEGVRLNSEASELLNPREGEAEWAEAVKRYNRAIESFNRGLKVNSTDGMTRISLITALKEQARAYRHLEEFDLALQNYEQAQRVWPDNLYLFLRGETLIDAGHVAMARPLLEEYVAKGEDASLRAQAEKYLTPRNNGARS